MIACSIAAAVYLRCGRAAPPAELDPHGRAALAARAHPPPASLTGDLSPPDTIATICARSGDALPRCVTASNSYEIDELPPGSYVAWASTAGRASPPQRIALASGDRGRADFALGDLAANDGAAVHGTIRDVRGHPIAGATIEIKGAGSAEVTTASEPDGTYTAWIVAGEVSARASADGYVDGEATGDAPGTIDVALVPESTLAGTVVDAATHAPVARADVTADGEHATTDAAGHYRITKLRPGRYKPSATAIGGYGEAAESVLVQLGHGVDGVVIEMHAVAVVAGRIALPTGAGCPAGDGEVGLSRYGSSAYYHAKTLDDGFVVVEGVLPGSYEVSVACHGWVSLVPYPDLAVADSDVEDVTWLVLDGAQIAGHVRSRADGKPVAGAMVNFIHAGGQGVGHVTTDAAGDFVARGVAPGSVELVVRADGFSRGASVMMVAERGTIAHADVVLDPGGAIRGTVTDDHGAPVSSAIVHASGDGDSGSSRTDAAGAYSIDGVAPGHYDLYADLGWATTTEHHSQAVDVATLQVARVDLVISRERLTLAGVVRDPAGAPIADAYVRAAREDDDGRAGSWGDDVLTAADGTFAFTDLPDGKYAVRASRPGAGDAIVAHATPRDSVVVVIQTTGSIAGVVVTPDGKPVDDVTVQAEARSIEVSREERAFHTGGRFALRDLPAGRYVVTVDGDVRSAQTITIGDGEQRADVRLVAQPRYTIRGRLVDARGTPLVGWRVEAPHLVSDNRDPDGGRHVTTYTTEIALSDASGRFLIRNMPGGPTSIAAGPPDASDDLPTLRDVVLADVLDVDVGDVVSK